METSPPPPRPRDSSPQLARVILLLAGEQAGAWEQLLAWRCHEAGEQRQEFDIKPQRSLSLGRSGQTWSGH